MYLIFPPIFSLPQLAEVNHNGLVCSAVLSPLSSSTALLSILQPVITQPNQLLTAEVIAPASAETSADLPDVVSSVLGVVYDIMKQDGDTVNGRIKIKNVWCFCSSMCHQSERRGLAIEKVLV